MDIRETVKNTLNESNLTNPSKLYTPFTLFAVYFAIYFKAELLGQIFLSDNWNITAQALARLGDPGPREWFIFASKVAAYSIGMLVLYGIAQFLAVGIWALSNRLNTRVNAELHRGKYVAASVLEEAEKKVEELRSDNRKLYTELASYHQWKPEDILRLEQDIDNQKISLEKDILKLKTKIKTLSDNERKYEDRINRHVKNTHGMFIYTREINLEINSIQIEDFLNRVELSARKQVADILIKMKSENKNISSWYFTEESDFLPNVLAILKKLQLADISLHLLNESLIGAEISFKERFWNNIDKIIDHLNE